MRRKLVKQGNATLMISLPSKWVKENNLDKGDEIILNEHGKDLIINTEEIKKEKLNYDLNIKNLYPLINRKATSLYIKGVDELEIHFENIKEIEDFQKRCLPELLGFEIIKQTQKSILVKDVTGVSNQDIDEFIRRIFLILDSMFDELIASLEKRTSTKLVVEIDSSINKFVNFSLRLLNKKGYKDISKNSQIYTIISRLEEIGDSLKSIAREFEKNKNVDKNQTNILKKLKESLEKLKELFFDFDTEKAVSFSKRFEEINKKINRDNSFNCHLHDLNLIIVKVINHLLVIN
jgi:phosphate uptake regulator